jgi:hypothetical protein
VEDGNDGRFPRITRKADDEDDYDHENDDHGTARTNATSRKMDRDALLTEDFVTACYRDAEGSRPVANWGKMPNAKIRTTMIHMATIESLLTGIAEALAGAGCQYIALTTFK